MKTSPLVSICIPTYNSALYLRESLQSIVNQTYPNKEIIICDNASTDGTGEIIKEYVNKHNKIIYIRNESNIGAEANFSKCVQIATGDYIAIFHSDDSYLPEIVQKEVDVLESNPNLGAVFSLAQYVDGSNNLIGKTRLPSELRSISSYDFERIFTALLKHGNIFLETPSAMVRSRIYKQLMPFDFGNYGTSADLDLWLRISHNSEITIINEYLLKYRFSHTNGSYLTRYLRIEEADYFKVINHYLSNGIGIASIPTNILNCYQFMRGIDKVRRSVNCIIRQELGLAKMLLKESISLNAMCGAVRNINYPRRIAYWGIGPFLLFLLNLGLGKYLINILRWQLYREKKKAR